MKVKGSKRLVIDASVALAASETASNMDSIKCRDFLAQVLKICHRMVFTDQLADEWRRNQSRYTRKWRRWMAGRRKIVQLNTDVSTIASRIKLSRLTTDIHALLLKDTHLVSAALECDCYVVSLDERARHHFFNTVLTDRERQKLVWINPGQIENVEEFLKELCG